MIEEQIFDALKGLVSNRCYPIMMPEKPTFPGIVYSRIANLPFNTVVAPSTLDQVRVQIDSYATTYSAAKSLAASVRTAMEGASFKATLQTDQDLYEPDVKVYRVSQDFYVWDKR